jgi:hypothetical protein
VTDTPPLAGPGRPVSHGCRFRRPIRDNDEGAVAVCAAVDDVAGVRRASESGVEVTLPPIPHDKTVGVRLNDVDEALDWVKAP